MPKLRVSVKSAALWLGAAILIFCIVGRLIAWGGCSWYGYQTDRETRYAAFVGCMVKVNDNWYPRNELRIVQ